MARARRPERYWLRQRSGIWQICWAGERPGEVCRRSTGERDRERAEIALARYRLGDADCHRGEAPLVGAILAEYLEARRGMASIEQACIAVQRYLAPRVGRLTVAELRQPRIEAEQADMLACGLSRAYVDRVWSVLRAAIRRAFRAGRCAAEPHIPTVGGAEPRQRWLTDDELRALMTACQLPHLRLYVALGAATGARPGAILDLTWDRVDLATGRITFGVPGARTTRKRRAVVPITPALAAILASAERNGPHVIQVRGERVASVKKAFRSACTAAGLGAEVTPYTLRHTAASRALQSGSSPWQVARLLGHTDTRMIDRTYGHHAPGHLAEAAAAAGGFLQANNRPSAGGGEGKMVGAAGIEPATPTMSTQVAEVNGGDNALNVFDLSAERRKRTGHKLP